MASWGLSEGVCLVGRERFKHSSFFNLEQQQNKQKLMKFWKINFIAADDSFKKDRIRNHLWLIKYDKA